MSRFATLSVLIVALGCSKSAVESNASKTAVTPVAQRAAGPDAESAKDAAVGSSTSGEVRVEPIGVASLSVEDRRAVLRGLTRAWENVFSLAAREEQKFSRIADMLDESDEVVLQDQVALRNACEVYYFEKGEWPQDLKNDLLRHDFIPSFPANPLTGSAAVQNVDSDEAGWVAASNNPDGGWIYNPKTGRVWAAEK